MMDMITVSIELPSGNGGSFDIDKQLYDIMGPEKVGEHVGQFVTDVLRRDIVAQQERELA